MYCRYLIIEFDEGAGTQNDDERNAYGPYYQTQRVDIYHVYAKSLVERGLAYPCFCTEEELEEVRKQQEEAKELTGYYGKYATCRNLSMKKSKPISKPESVCIKTSFTGKPG